MTAGSLLEAKTKADNGRNFPAAAYAYVPDPQAPSTWKLRLWEMPARKETARQVGLAVAALGKGFRGRRVRIPAEDLPKVKARVRAAWKRVNPDRKGSEMPAVIRESKPADNGTVRLIEYVCSAGLSLPVDREQAVIHGVKVLGVRSANGRRYLPEALRGAAPLYEGLPVNVDHAGEGKRRSYRDRFGRLAGVEHREDGLYADLHYNPKHPLSEQFTWDAEHSPQNVGLSHDAVGRTVRRNGVLFVEQIESVRSVDLVADPATTAGLFESVVKENSMSVSLQEMTLEQFQAERPDLVEQLAEQFGEEHLGRIQKQQIEAQKNALVEAREENQRLQTELARHQRRQAVAEELEQAGLDAGNKVQVSELFWESLLATETPADRQKLIEDRKALAGAAEAGRRQVTSQGRRQDGLVEMPLAEQVASWRM